jgi:hypothetical protein
MKTPSIVTLKGTDDNHLVRQVNLSDTKKLTYSRKATPIKTERGLLHSTSVKSGLLESRNKAFLLKQPSFLVPVLLSSTKMTTNISHALPNRPI